MAVSTEDETVWLTEQDVVGLVDLADTIEALELMVSDEHRGQAYNITKALGTWGDKSSAHALGAVAEACGLACFKTWVNTPRGAVAILTLFDAEQGRLLAVIEAGAVGALRTAGVTGVATRLLAPAGSRTMALIGSGRQALQQVAAVHLTTPLDSVRVYSPTEEHREAIVRRIGDELGIEASAAATLEEAVEGQPIVTTVTRAREPFLDVADLASDVHLNAVGAILPANAELLPNVLAQARTIAVDSLDNAKAASRELIEHLADGSGDWSSVVPLHALVGGSLMRASGPGVSVFKGMGMGISDLAVAATAYERARESGVGATLAHPTPARPRWKAAPR